MRTPVNRTTLIAVLTMAFLVLIFGLIAQEVAGGETSAFDHRLILLLRDPAKPSVPIGPARLQEAARDVTSLGSIVVLVIVTLAAVGYLFLARQRISAWLLLVAVFGGIALVDLLKAVFARPRPDLVLHAARGGARPAREGPVDASAPCFSRTREEPRRHRVLVRRGGAPRCHFSFSVFRRRLQLWGRPRRQPDRAHAGISPR